MEPKSKYRYITPFNMMDFSYIGQLKFKLATMAYHNYIEELQRLWKTIKLDHLHLWTYDQTYRDLLNNFLGR